MSSYDYSEEHRRREHRIQDQVEATRRIRKEEKRRQDELESRARPRTSGDDGSLILFLLAMPFKALWFLISESTNAAAEAGSAIGSDVAKTTVAAASTLQEGAKTTAKVGMTTIIMLQLIAFTAFVLYGIKKTLRK